MTVLHMILLAAGGFSAGLIGALFGLGGGILIIPILVLLMKVPMHNAIATSLVCVIATSSAAASRNLARGLANIRLGMTLEVWTVIGAMVGGLAAGLLPGNTLMILFAVMMIIMSVPMARGVEETDEKEVAGGDEGEQSPLSRLEALTEMLGGEYYDHAEQREVRYQVRRLPVALGVASLAGVLSGLLGVGGGILKVPALTTWCNIPMKAAAATSNFMIGVTAVASAFVFYGRGEVLPMLTAASVVGVFAGSRSGTVLSSRIRAGKLRKAFAVIMIIVALQMLWKAMGGSY